MDQMHTLNTSQNGKIEKEKKRRHKWKPAVEARLIELMKKHVLLWNPKDPDYSNFTKRNECYGQIADEMNMGPLYDKHKIRDKIKNLRDSFQREEKRFREQNGTFVSKWEHYNAMCFLKEDDLIDVTREAYIAETPMDGTGPLEIEFPTEEEVVLGQSTSEQTQSFSETLPLDLDFPMRRRHRPIKNTEKYEKVTEKFFDLLCGNPKDDCDHFGFYVGTHLKSFPQEKRAKAKKIIQDLLFDLCLEDRRQSNNHLPCSHNGAPAQTNQPLIVSVGTEFDILNEFGLT